MGWWSTDILGGDGPYDVRGELIEVIVGQRDPDAEHFWYMKGTKKSYRMLLNNNMRKVVRAAKNLAEGYEEAGQVLGYIIMELGANMSRRTKAFILQSARNDLWAQENDERKAVIDDFIAKVKAYVPGKPVKMEHKGLFATISEHIADGKEGLVNK